MRGVMFVIALISITSRFSEEDTQESVSPDHEMDALLAHQNMKLRQVSSLQFGDPCDPTRQGILDNPPIKPTALEIRNWQKKLISEPLTPLCNNLNYLQCSPDSSTCVCRQDLIYQVQGDCALPVGANCGSDFYYTTVFFDPLINPKELIVQSPPGCGIGLICCHRPLFFQQKCWCNPSLLSSTCSERPFFNRKPNYVKLKLGIQNLFVLEHGDTCDPEFQKHLLNPSQHELTDTYARVAHLKRMTDSHSLLCNINHHLNCSDTTRRCECWKSAEGEQLILDSSLRLCVANQGASCGQTSIESHFYENGPRIHEIERAFSKKGRLHVKCMKRARCLVNQHYQSRCACIGNFFGPDCQHLGSYSTRPLLKSKSYGPLIRSSDFYKAFDEVNTKMVLLENRLSLSLNFPCDIMEEDKLDTIATVWAKIGSSWGLKEDAPRSEPYATEQEILAVKDLVDQTLKNPLLQFCDRKRGYWCNDRTHTCCCARGTLRQGSMCRILAGHNCDILPTNWSLPCIEHATCISTATDSGICECISGPNGTDWKGRHICKGPSLDQVLKERDSLLNYLDPSLGETERLTTQQTQNSSNENNNHPNSSVENSSSFLGEEVDCDAYEYIREISKNRTLGFQEKRCVIEDNAQFKEIVLQLSKTKTKRFRIQDFSNRSTSSTEATQLYSELTELLAKGGDFCALEKHLVCASPFGTCECYPNLTLGMNEECRLSHGQECIVEAVAEQDFCNSYFLSSPRCHDGLSCIAISKTGRGVCEFTPLLEKRTIPVASRSFKILSSYRVAIVTLKFIRVFIY